MPSSIIKPIYLLSDSQLLFNKISYDRYYLYRIKENFLPDNNVKAVYIGASNNDRPEFFEIFKAGMTNIGITNCTLIKSEFDSDDEQHLASADLVLLAGGDSYLGWNIIKKSGMLKIILDGYKSGVQLIGVSAGSMQLGAQLTKEMVHRHTNDLVNAMGLIPYQISAHDENNNWEYLKNLILRSDRTKKGIGIPFGAGAIFNPNGNIEAIGRSVNIFESKGGVLKHRVLEKVY